MKLKKLFRSMIGETNYGRMEYFLRPKLRNGQPLNGQAHRQRIFSDIVHNFPLRAIVETGAFRGTTTSFFARMALPVYAVEINPRFYSYCAMRFRHAKKNVRISFGDSRSFLKGLWEDPSVPKQSVFFYLDAHWSNDLPLRGEVEMIFSHWKKSVVMIDDFCVPGTDYGFDSYSPDKTLDLDYLMPVLAAQKLAVFFPSVDSSQETGWKRGTAVLCQDDEIMATMEKFDTLRRYPAQVRKIA
ncbi:MAG: hypothetical protein ACREUQ_11315 [Burkholderiales bacterium]